VPLTVTDWSGLSLAVGVALCEAIETIRTPDSGAARLGLKWPNDLWLGAPGEGGRKLGGLLIETVAAGSQRLAVIGVGINVEPFDAADALASGFACARELDPAIDAPALLRRVALPLAQAVHLFAEQGFAAFAARFAAHDLLVGKAVQTTSAEWPEGVVRGVSAHGALLLQTPRGVREGDERRGQRACRTAVDRRPHRAEPLMLRLAVVVLLLANLGFCAWTQGWLDDVVGVRAAGDREPERVTRQVKPELIQVLSPQAAASAAATTACLEAGPFGGDEIGGADAALQSALPADTRSTVATVKIDRPAQWIVYMGKYPNREALLKKAEELKRRNVKYDEVRSPPTLDGGLSLGRYDDRAAAERALAQFGQQGIQTARVAELSPPAAPTCCVPLQPTPRSRRGSAR